MRRTLGERFGYVSTTYYPSGPANKHIAYHVYRVGPDGSYAMAWVLPPELQISTVEAYDAAGNLTLYDEIDTSNPDLYARFRCDYEPAEGFLEFPLFVGHRWANRWQAICNPAEYDPDEIVATHEVVAYEAITVPAGRFDTLHVRSEYVDGQLVRECWWSPELGLNVKCQRSNRASPEAELRVHWELDLEQAPQVPVGGPDAPATAPQRGDRGT